MGLGHLALGVQHVAGGVLGEGRQVQLSRPGDADQDDRGRAVLGRLLRLPDGSSDRVRRLGRRHDALGSREQRARLERLALLDGCLLYTSRCV